MTAPPLPSLPPSVLQRPAVATQAREALRPALQWQAAAVRGAVLQMLAALLWLPQAALLAWALQALAEGGGLAAVRWPAAGVLAIGLLRALCEACGLRRLFADAREQVSLLRARLAQALAGRSPLDTARPASGLAASAMAEQAEAVLPYLLRYRPAQAKMLVVPLAIVLTVLPLSWVAALILLLAAPLIPLFMALVGWRAKAASEAQLAGMGDMNAFLLDRLRGLATLRALGAIDATALRLRASAEGLRRRTMAVLRIAFLSSAVLELFAALGVAMVAVYIGFHLLGNLPFGAWGQRLNLGQGLFVLLLAPAFFEPLRELSAAWHDRAAGVAAIDSIDKLCVTGQAWVGANEQAAASPVEHENHAVALRVDAIHFTHPRAAAPVFNAFSLDVAAGEHLAIVGDSGAGKSTLLALIAGLAPLQAGRILLDGVPLQAASAAALRQRMAWVAQRPHVFAGSVRHNVALGRTEVGRDAVQRALHDVALASVAQARPDVAMGEAGIGMSGGELVRLALARAAVHTRAGLLLVDEPTAHLDSETAAEVIDALLRIADGKTLIVATHDPALAARMDRTVRLLEAGGARP